MDESHLKKILQDTEIPLPDQNAKKRAVNLALAEFDVMQKEKEKNFQGKSLLARLMGNSDKQKRRDPMEQASRKKLIYGGMATAMAVVLVAGISVNQLMNNTIGSTSESAAYLNTVEFETDSSAPSGVKGVPGQEEVSAEYRADSDRLAPAKKQRNELRLKEKAEQVPVTPEYREAVEEINQRTAEAAVRTGGSALPVPTSPPAEAKTMMRQDMAVAGASRSIISQEGMAVPYAQPVSPPMVVMDEAQQNYYKDVGRDKFKDFEENPVKLVSEEPVSTFSVDVDTSSYSFMRRQLNSGVLPQKDAVRIEEMVNYFDYDYALPESKEQPFASHVNVVPSPWKDGNKLVHIGIKGYDIDADTAQPRSNLVFLLDTSGSMNSPDKLPLVVNSLKLLLDRLQPTDTVGIVVYAGSAGTVLEPTPVSDKTKILQALDRLSAGGSTAGAEGIRQAYQLAESNFDKEAVNRVILATDGDFNVGITNPEELKDFVERKRETGVFLSVLGFGQGNLNDNLMQELAQNGNGVAAYIDTLNEARKVLVDEATSTLFPIAKDVKIQVEFNPDTVAEYRLIGYETRHLNREDFNNDAVDAGDIGAGHTVTAIYEITPVDGPRLMDDSRYGANKAEPAAEKVKADTDFGNEYAFLKIRYKLPNEDTSKLITTPIKMEKTEMTATTVQETNWATAVAGFGQLLKGGKYVGDFDYDDVIELAQTAKGKDEFGYRAEFIQLVRLAKSAAALQKN